MAGGTLQHAYAGESKSVDTLEEEGLDCTWLWPCCACIVKVNLYLIAVGIVFFE